MDTRGKILECPLILPDGNIMTPNEFFAGRYKQFDFEDNPEVVDENLRRIYLNEREQEVDRNFYANSNPEKVVRDLLQNLMDVLRSKNNIEINHYDALSLTYMVEVQQIFNETCVLKYIDISKLQTVEETTCFFINLTNLMWIQALFSMAADAGGLRNGLIYKNWSVRHIYYNMVGYTVNGLGFVSLYDLHSSLLQYPLILRSEKLDSLTFLKDDRIDFVLAQPYTFSPKIRVLDPENLDKLLTDLKDNYLRMCLVIESHVDLLIPIPLLMHIERISYDQMPEDEEEEDDKNEEILPRKLDVLIEILKKREIPYYELVTKDIYTINDTQFKVKFEYNIYEKQTLNAFQKMTWKYCKLHKSVYYCLQHQISLVRSTTQNEHALRNLCNCEDKTRLCLNNTLLRLNEMYDPLLNEYNIRADYDNRGVRCLYSCILFAIGVRSRCKISADSLAENIFYIEVLLCSIEKRFKIELSGMRCNFQHMLDILADLYLKIPTSCICRKINLCVRVCLSISDVREKWSHWSSIFTADPSDILVAIVLEEDVNLANEWVAANLAVHVNYMFSLEVYSKYICLLTNTNDINGLKKALENVNGLKILDICDFLIKNNCPPVRLISLITIVLEMSLLNSIEKRRTYSLLVGVKLINAMPKHEQVFCFEIVYNPLLIVEQQILNKKIFSIKMALKEVSPFILSLPEDVQQMETLSRIEIDELIRVYASKTLHFRKKPTSEDCKYAAVLHAVIFKDGHFHPPDQVPSMHLWVPNNWVTNCMCCKTAVFSVFIRRHHCRRCGRVVCDQCSMKRMKVATYKGLVRICNQCYEFESQYDSSEDSASETSFAADDNGKKPTWKLSENNEFNDLVRKQATFDTAPDIELCLSILELHSENIAVPRFLYSHAENMIKIIRQRLVCPANFDYAEVSHIIRSLLLAAKLYYTHLGEQNGIRRCEELTSEMDILNQLAKIKFLPIEPTKPIRDIQELQRIRDTLLEKQQWDLALEISTKIGLECTSIWYVWGKTCLKSGDWSSARDKFTRSSLKKNSAMLDDVLELLCASAQEKDNPKGFAKFFKSAPKKSCLSENAFNECLHYLHNYGTARQLFEFYVKYERVTDAVRITFTRKVSPKLFLLQVYIPHSKEGEHTKVLKIMKSLDETLVQWKDYINEMCVYCNDNKRFQELYEIQTWMKDYFRAAISCTMFYKGGATTYAQLGRNEEHIQNAILHLQACLKQPEDNKLAKVADPQSILKCLNTATLQLVITRIIVKNNVCANTKFATVPTLFNNEEEKVDVIVLIFEAMNDVPESFQLVDKLVNEYSLNTVTVYTKVAENFMRLNQESNVIEIVTRIKETSSAHAKLVDAIVVATVKAKPQKIETFLAFISDITTKIEMHIEVGWLKTAYMLAAKHKKLDYVKKILVEAKRLNMTAIERICAKKLGVDN